MEVRQIGEESPLFGQATQVEHEALFLNPPDEGSRQIAQHRRQAFQLGAWPLGGDGETGARDGFQRQRAGPDLALAFAQLDREIVSERLCYMWQQAPRLRLDLMLRSRQHPKRGESLGEPGGIPIEFEGGLDGGQHDLVNAKRALYRIAIDGLNQIALADN